MEGSGIMVCGSPNEAANDPSLGYQFDVTTGEYIEWGLERQPEYVWVMIGLNAQDQVTTTSYCAISCRNFQFTQ